MAKPVWWKKISVRAINVFRTDDATLLATVSQGEHVLNGFRNRDLRSVLFPDTKDPDAKRKQSTQITRKLRMLRAHGLIAKISHTHRYILTEKGRLLCAAIQVAVNANTEQLLKIAA